MCNKCCDIFSQRYPQSAAPLSPCSPFSTLYRLNAPFRYPLPMILERNKRKRVAKGAPNGFRFVVGVADSCWPQCVCVCVCVCEYSENRLRATFVKGYSTGTVQK